MVCILQIKKILFKKSIHAIDTYKNHNRQKNLIQLLLVTGKINYCLKVLISTQL